MDELKNDKSKLSLMLGEDENGKPYLRDMTELGNILISGGPGSGYQTLFRNCINNFGIKYSKDEVMLDLIDTTQVDMRVFEKNDNLFHNKIFAGEEQGIYGLKLAARESVYRYHTMKEIGANNIDDYNASEEVKSGKLKALPYLVVVILDYFTFLPLNYRREIEDYLMQIKENSKSSGVYVIGVFCRASQLTSKMALCFDTQIAFTLNKMKFQRWMKYKKKEVENLDQFEMIFAHGEEKLKLKAIYEEDNG
ncbi:MAG: hypothetical protein IJ538_03515 [Clostridia bacterium]|nr:hypothetical protein [Clostridia bacterium]